MTVTVTVRSNRFGDVVRQLGARSIATVDETAEEIRQRASQLAPKDTGSLRASIYVSNGDNGDYSQRSGDARDLNDDAVIVGEVRPEFVISLGGQLPDTAYTSVVGVSVGHGIFQELGTIYIPARPYMIPSTEGVANDFINAMSSIADI